MFFEDELARFNIEKTMSNSSDRKGIRRLDYVATLNEIGEGESIFLSVSSMH